MILWNKCAFTVDPESKTDQQLATAILDCFLPEYVIQKDVSEDIFLSHLINLYNACVLRPQ